VNRPRQLTTMRLLRERLAISQVELARDIGVTQSRISMWESLAAPIPSARRAQIAKALGCEPEQLLVVRRFEL
jgi:transcriptional regulator with XRE-family HTH domain